MPTMRTDILILGGGIGGYEAYRRLARDLQRTKQPLTITVVDANNYYTFTPLLHEAATGGVEPAHCAIPLRELVESPHQFVQATVERIDPAHKKVQTSAGVIDYTWCVMALGSAVNYWNVPGAEEHTYNVRTLNAAMRFHNDLVKILESKQSTITLTIVGGGWTGVEVAGQCAQLAKKDIAKKYPNKKIKIFLLEGGAAILPQLPAAVREQVRQRLKKSGVTIKLNELAKAVGSTTVTLSSGQSLASDLVIWTTGFENVAACYVPDSMCTKGRLTVNERLQHNAHTELYAIGDIAYAIDPTTNAPYGQLGETAAAQAKFVARDIINRLTKKPRSVFSFQSIGSLIPLGNWDGAARIGRLTFFGPLAWVTRHLVYLLVIPTIKAKFKIALDWALHSFGGRYILGTSQASPSRWDAK